MAEPLRQHIARFLVRRALTLSAAVLLAAFFAACMVRIAPGFAADPAQLDARLSPASLAALRAERERNRNIATFYFHYLRNAARGDLGDSLSFHRPVAALIRERSGATAQLIVLGLLFGWALAVSLALAVVLLRHSPVDPSATVFAGFFLCIPAAVLALASVLWRAPAWLVIALVVFPKVFSYTRNLLLEAEELPHVVSARAKGLGPMRVLIAHTLPVIAPQTIALAGISVSMAVGAAIPVEAFLSVPGLGQLAWQAALGRDLPLLVGVTFAVATVTLAANAAAELMNEVMNPITLQLKTL